MILSIYKTKYGISVEGLRKIVSSPLVYIKMDIGGRGKNLCL